MKKLEKLSKLSGKQLSIKHLDVPYTGVRGRNSDNNMIREKLGWEPNIPLLTGMTETYQWIKEKVEEKQKTTNT